MIICKISWWLGNQMFQYANWFAISNRIKSNMWLDLGYYEKNANRTVRIYELWNLFGVNEQEIDNNNLSRYIRNTTNKFLHIIKIIYKKMMWKISKKYYLEPWFDFDKNIYNIKDNTYIEWYFQSEKYFQEYKENIKEKFKFKKELSAKSKEVLNQIHNSNSAFLHIRRWDYVSNKITNTIHWTCWLEYYDNAIKKLNQDVQNITYYIFSDDMERVKQNLKIDNAIYVDHNHWDNSWQDMTLMSNCQNAIIANSTFSRRWAYLIKNENKHIYWPAKWSSIYDYKDIYPEWRITI